MSQPNGWAPRGAGGGVDCHRADGKTQPITEDQHAAGEVSHRTVGASDGKISGKVLNLRASHVTREHLGDPAEVAASPGNGYNEPGTHLDPQSLETILAWLGGTVNLTVSPVRRAARDA